MTNTEQEVNINILCQSVPTLAQERCPQLVPHAQYVCKTFQKAFTLFGQCHSVYDSGGILSDTDIAAVGR